VKSRRAAPQYVSSAASCRERALLVAALQDAGLGVEATRIASDEHTPRVDGLDDSRTKLLVRLHRRSDDYRATSALKALDTFTAGRRAESPLTVEEARRWPRVSDAA
jgi:hypothetical protein